MTDATSQFCTGLPRSVVSKPTGTLFHPMLFLNSLVRRWASFQSDFSSALDQKKSSIVPL
jgi:hypothetical protein